MDGRTGWRRSITNGSDDRRRVAAFLSGSDETSFRALYRAHTPALFRLAMRILGGRGPDSEEVVQTTWIRAMKRLGSFRWESSLRTWLFGIAINGCREVLRRRVQEEALSVREAPGETVGPAPRESERIDLERIVASLPDGYRAVLVLHDIEGYTHDEIARLLQIEVGTSKSQLSRARQALRARLAPDPDAEVSGKRTP